MMSHGHNLYDNVLSLIDIPVFVIFSFLFSSSFLFTFSNAVSFQRPLSRKQILFRSLTKMHPPLSYRFTFYVTFSISLIE